MKSSLPLSLLLTLLSLISHNNVVVSASSSSSSSFKTFPLVPYHAQRMRRLEEGRNLSAEHKRPQQVTTPEQQQQQQHSIRRRRTVAQEVGALYQGYGTHYVDLWCGSPPQRQTVIVDTGSGVTAFPCSGCSQCGVPQYHVDQLFVEANSATFSPNTCGGGMGCKTSRSSCHGSKCSISMSYAEGSKWDAYEATDKCYIGGPHEIPLVDGDGAGATQDDIDPNHAQALAFDLAFGCQTLVTGLFKTQLADGIMGMDNKSEAFWNQMYNAGKMGTDRQFALCFARQPTAERMGTESGAVTLGGADPRLHSTDMVYTSNANGGRSGFFSVKVRNMYLRDGSAGESVGSALVGTEGIVKVEISEGVLNQGGVIVDSGTTDTYWNKQLARAFNPVFLQLAGTPHNNNAQSLTATDLAALPTILFQLEADPTENTGKDPNTTPGLAGQLDPLHPTDVIVAFPPSHYMEYDSETGKYTSRFYMTETGGSVLGGNTMMGHDVMFDADKNRIGWAESDCDYTSLVTSSGYDFAITGNLQEPPAPGTTTAVETTLPAVIATPTSAPVGGMLVVPTLPPVPAPTEAPVVDPTVPPTEMPVPAPTEIPVTPPVPEDTTTIIDAGASTTTTFEEESTPVAAPVQEVAPVAVPVADTQAATKTEAEAEPCEEGEDCEKSKFQEILDKVWAFLVDAYAFVKEAVEKFLEVCDTPECRYPVGIGLAISLVAGCCFSYCCSCLFYCLCCRCCRKKPKTGPKYQTLSRGEDDDDETELEMVNGKSFSTYKDDPLPNGNGNGHRNGSSSSSSKRGGGRGFKDEPSSNGGGMKVRIKETKKSPSNGKKKPEFQGDFI
eukprot:CAMPEP_0117043908 /NCGR_PEP_ID=MMETSP0472-20121206/30483_1 /TAXON_ID=693140 ORGANISM="Tiarina fusus, Strain LIS" /NCGR_SAMPLE_ID=MMETSP0472 /ASSEMBLY_ACC=CAM_ASM_000603 /LENGTH=837 /DNA_ID=CAMNT_0004755537 /DNA_START=208 /DNA_END=2721 /DNA_ORIENTATION=+